MRCLGKGVNSRLRPSARRRITFAGDGRELSSSPHRWLSRNAFGLCITSGFLCLAQHKIHDPCTARSAAVDTLISFSWCSLDVIGLDNGAIADTSKTICQNQNGRDSCGGPKICPSTTNAHTAKRNHAMRYQRIRRCATSHTMSSSATARKTIWIARKGPRP